MRLTARQLTGLDSSHVVAVDNAHRLEPEVVQAFARLQHDARIAGFDLAIASSFRSFARQLKIFNEKANGNRVVHDDRGRVLDLTAMPASEKLRAILRYSALPGTSRHHWGTDLDVYDAAAMDADYEVQLHPEEVGPGGVFYPLHEWLDQRMRAGRSHGFFRPYDVERGGVAPERWHLSYAPLSLACADHVDDRLLYECWDTLWSGEGLALRAEIDAHLTELMQRYVAVPRDWCPGV